MTTTPTTTRDAYDALLAAVEALADTDPDITTINAATAAVNAAAAGDDPERAARRAALSGDIADLLRTGPTR